MIVDPTLLFEIICCLPIERYLLHSL